MLIYQIMFVVLLHFPCCVLLTVYHPLTTNQFPSHWFHFFYRLVGPYPHPCCVLPLFISTPSSIPIHISHALYFSLCPSVSSIISTSPFISAQIVMPNSHIILCQVYMPVPTNILPICICFFCVFVFV